MCRTPARVSDSPVATRALSRSFQFARSSADGAVPIQAICRDSQYLSKGHDIGTIWPTCLIMVIITVTATKSDEA